MTDDSDTHSKRSYNSLLQNTRLCTHEQIFVLHRPVHQPCPDSGEVTTHCFRIPDSIRMNRYLCCIGLHINLVQIVYRARTQRTKRKRKNLLMKWPALTKLGWERTLDGLWRDLERIFALKEKRLSSSVDICICLTEETTTSVELGVKVVVKGWMGTLSTDLTWFSCFSMNFLTPGK